MSFFEKLDLNQYPFHVLQDETYLCFECGEKITGAAVSYDGHTSEEYIKSIFFHPKCANLVGQRLIADGFKNRRKP